jgi:FkbM family methyltransferase
VNQFSTIETGRKNRIVGLYSQAHNLAIGGDYAQALELYDRIVADVPGLVLKTPQINYERALCLKAIGRIEEAEQAIRSCLSMRPDDSRAQNLLVDIQTEQYRNSCDQVRRDIARGNSLYATLNFKRFSMYLDLTDKSSIYMAACHRANLLEPFELSVFCDMIRANPHGLIIDIGANYGLYTLHACDLARYGIVGKVVAVEPDRQVFEKLSESVRQNGFEGHVVLINKAASNVVGEEVQLYINANGSVDNRTFVDGGIECANHYPVETVTIDSIVTDTEKGGFRPSSILVKIDIQGSEPCAIRGMANTLSKYPSIGLFFELDPKMMQGAGFDPVAFAHELFRIGFDSVANLNETLRSLHRVNNVDDLIRIIKQCNSVGRSDPRRYTNILCCRNMNAPSHLSGSSALVSVGKSQPAVDSARPSSCTDNGGEARSFLHVLENEGRMKTKLNVARYCPETCIVFVSYGRADIAARSYNSLVSALAPYRDRVRIIISDATDDNQKIMWARQTDADDVILTPRFTPAATSRNVATTMLLDKYAPKYLCMVEDDFEYAQDWYPSLVEAANRLYGVLSPFNLAYGMFSACDHHIPAERRREDGENNVTAYMFGAVAYQRFTPTWHYLSVMRCWDADLLGISYAQTGGQTFRNVMRGFCGAVLAGRLSWPIDADKTRSTWDAKCHPGPPAHSFNLEDYSVIQAAAGKAGVYQQNEKQ